MAETLFPMPFLYPRCHRAAVRPGARLILFICGDDTGITSFALWENRSGTYRPPGPLARAGTEQARTCIRLFPVYWFRMAPTAAGSSAAAVAADADRRGLGVSRLNCRIL